MTLNTRDFELSDVTQAIGISQDLIYRARKGEPGINQKFIHRAIKAFPKYKLNDLFDVKSEKSEGEGK